MSREYSGPPGAPAVIVSGMIADTPNRGGATWAILQYLIGLRSLGCAVTFVEPVDEPLRDGRATYCASVMNDNDLSGRWCLVRSDGTTIGMDRSELTAAAREADVLINVSGMLTDVDVLERIDRRVYLDLDPGFVQMWHDDGVDMRFDSHTHFASLADNIGSQGSAIPTCGRTWIPTLPPVVLAAWSPVAETVYDSFTTVAHWRSYGSIHRGGVVYGQKAHSLRSIVDLPRRVDDRFHLALDIHPDETNDLADLAANGWALIDPDQVAATPDLYRDFVRGSRAELGVAKSGYVESQSGWFSDRSACYLASGRPVIAQSTGFERRLPTGDGLFSFVDVDEIAAAVESIRGDPCGQRVAARAVAEQHLSAEIVLTRLLESIS
jgi:hypothetical protein